MMKLCQLELQMTGPMTEAGFSRTDTANVEHPLFVYGAGAVFGAVFPVVLWLAALGTMLRRSDCPKGQEQSACAARTRFFAGFCLIANGAYIGADFSITGPTGAGLLMEHGANRVVLVLFGLICVSSGLFLWHAMPLRVFMECGRLART